MVGDFENETYQGIIPRSFDYLFEEIEKDKDHKYNLMVSFIQIYLETLQDLLEPKNKDIRIREDPEKGVYLEGVQWIKVKSTVDCANIFRFGEKNRVTESTRMNAHSSRSHAILIVRIEKNIMLSQEKITELSKETNEQIKAERVMTRSMLFLVDLAGSERVKKTKAENMRLEEAKKINYSLLVLGNCISSLTDKNSSHVSYRDSKLTRLLQESLGGNAKTCLIVTVSPSGYNTEETLSSLNFALRAMKVQNKPIINQSVDYQALSIKLQEDLDKLNDQFALLKIDYDKLQEDYNKLKNGEAFIEMQRKSIVNSLQSNRDMRNIEESKGESSKFDKKNNKKKGKSLEKKEEDYVEEMKKLEMFYEEVLKTKTDEYENILKEIDKILLDKEIEIETALKENSSLKTKLKDQYDTVIDIQKEKDDLMKSVADLTNKLNDEERLNKNITISESKGQISKLNTTIESLESKIIQLEKQNDALTSISLSSVNSFLSQLDEEVRKLTQTKAEFLQQKNNFVIKSSQNEIKIKIDMDDVSNLKAKVNTVTEEMKKIIKGRISDSLKQIKERQEENKTIAEEKQRLGLLITDLEKEIAMKTELQETIRNMDDDTLRAKDKTQCVCELMLNEINMKLSLSKSEREKKCLISSEDNIHALKQEIVSLKEQNIKLALSANKTNQTDQLNQKAKEAEKEKENSLIAEREGLNQQLKAMTSENTQLKQVNTDLNIKLNDEICKEKEKNNTLSTDNTNKEGTIKELKEDNDKLKNEIKTISNELKLSKEKVESTERELRNVTKTIEQLNQETNVINNELKKKEEIVKSSINVNENFNKEMKTKISEYTSKTKDNHNEITQLKDTNIQLQSVISQSNDKLNKLYQNISKSIQSFHLFEEEFQKINLQLSASSPSLDLTSLAQLIDNDALSEDENDYDANAVADSSQKEVDIEKRVDNLIDKFLITKGKIEIIINCSYSLAQQMKKSLEDSSKLKQYQIDKMHQFLTALSLQDMSSVPLVQKKIYSCTQKIAMTDLFNLTNEVYNEILSKYYFNMTEKDQEITHLNDRIEYFIKELDIIKKTNEEIGKGSSSTSKIQSAKYESQLKLKNDELAKVNKRLDHQLKLFNENKKEMIEMQKELSNCHSTIKLLQDKYDKQSKNIEEEEQYKIKQKVKLANKDINTGKYIIKEYFGKTSKYAFDLFSYCSKSNE